MGETSLESRETGAGSLDPARPLREELAERVETHRIRRAQMRGEPAESMSLEFDFDGAGCGEAHPPEEPELVLAPGDQEVFEIGEVEPPSLETEPASLDSLSLEEPDEAAQLLDSVVRHLTDDPPPALETAEPQPVEIVLDSPLGAAEADGFEGATVSLPLAPMGRRFVAGVLDAFVLLLSAGLFAFIFWRAGGHITLKPGNMAVLAFIPAFLIMAYFGLFTALTSTTPGLLWMGLEVRSMGGAAPTPQEAFWRAFGCLVSASALLLGFVWAIVDSEGLTWHDRMSRTFLATVSPDDAP